MTVWFALSRWCGVGYDSGLFPEVRLGFLRFGWCKGVIAQRLRALLAHLEGKAP